MNGCRWEGILIIYDQLFGKTESTWGWVFGYVFGSNYGS
jgi:hypothetical protein